MTKIEDLTDEKLEEILTPIWKYLAVANDPKPSDIIFVFGGLDLAVPARAANLFLKGFAPLILVSGNVGPFSKNVFSQPEAYVFKQKMIEMGVPESSIITEIKATNALENVLFGMKLIEEKNLKIDSALLVAKPFLMRRSLATFQKQYPRIILLSCPPQGPILSFSDRTREDFAKRLLAELNRLKVYAEKGDITPQPLPDDVVGAADTLNSHLSQS